MHKYHHTCHTPHARFILRTWNTHTHTEHMAHMAHMAHATRHMLIYMAHAAICHLNTTRMPLVHTHTRTRACINATHATCTRNRHFMPTCNLLFATCTHRSRDTVHACSFCTYACHIIPHPRAHDTHTTHAYGTCYTRTCHLRTRTRTRTCTHTAHFTWHTHAACAYGACHMPPAHAHTHVHTRMPHGI
jgi:hypothetical protein